LSNLIALLVGGEYIDADGMLRTTLPLDAIDPNHRDVPPDLREKLLHLRYHANYIEDALQTGQLEISHDGRFLFRTKLPVESFVGFAFEAYVVRELNRSKNLLRRALIWCTQRMQVKEGFLAQITAIGTGLIATKNEYKAFYEPQSKLDVKFVRPKYNRERKEHFFDLMPRYKTSIPAGIQVKAIRWNEKIEIVDKVLSGEYSHVLTCLYNNNARFGHTRDVCHRILENMFKAGSLEAEKYFNAVASIRGPSDLGYDQQDMTEYYHYILSNYPNVQDPGELTDLMSNVELSGRFSRTIIYPGEKKIVVPDMLNFQIEE
jgi:hypothetical protein